LCAAVKIVCAQQADSRGVIDHAPQGPSEDIQMPLTNSSNRYGSLSRLLHWSMAIAILAMFPLGKIAHDAPFDTAEQLARKAQLFSAHKTLGVVVLGLAVVRIGWTLSQVHPQPLHPARRLETLAASVVHLLLYVSLVAVPLTGWVHHAASQGFAPIWGIGQSLPFVPKDLGLSETAGALHGVFVKLLGVSLLLHIAGALKHHVIDRDDTLRRMTRGIAALPQKAGHPASSPWVAKGIAVAIWSAALAVTLSQAPAPTPSSKIPLGGVQPPAPAAAQGNWVVRDGSLGLSVQQFGQTVSGEFAQWHAQITFEDSPGDGIKGAVEVRVDTRSLRLGSVTEQAKGADYLAVSQFPQAVFVADIHALGDRYEAQGTLRLRDVEVPVSLPFVLTLSGDTAKMQGNVTLDRRLFGIGDAMTDEGQLGFEVVVPVALTAQRVQN
jgi:cytochrome b561/polyisoprenoid-binding protein YceI